MTSALQPGVKGARHTAQVVTFGRSDSSETVDLDGTITGTLRDNVTKVTRAVDGTLVGNTTTGAFTWTYGAADVGTVGTFTAQFKVTYGDTTYELSLPTQWTVEEAIVV